MRSCARNLILCHKYIRIYLNRNAMLAIVTMSIQKMVVANRYVSQTRGKHNIFNCPRMFGKVLFPKIYLASPNTHVSGCDVSLTKCTWLVVNQVRKGIHVQLQIRLFPVRSKETCVFSSGYHSNFLKLKVKYKKVCCMINLGVLACSY